MWFQLPGWWVLSPMDYLPRPPVHRECADPIREGTGFAVASAGGTLARAPNRDLRVYAVGVRVKQFAVLENRVDRDGADPRVHDI